MLIKELNHRPVRDLAWLLYRPGLLTSLPGHPQAVDFSLTDPQVPSWLLALDRCPDLLDEYISSHSSKRVGIYAEQLLGFYFSEYSRFDLLLKNAQIFDDKRTLGELDFIIFDNLHKQFIHMECAIKFYLGYLCPAESLSNNNPFFNWHHWIGPNQKDTLALKMQRLTKHQLPLIEHPKTQALLAQQGIPIENLSNRLYLLGRLYFPQNLSVKAADYAREENPRPYWIRLDEFKPQALLNNKTNYCMLPKNYWLSPLIEEDIDDKNIIRLNAKELIKNIEQESDLGIQNWHIATSESVGPWQEKHRFFITL